MGEGIEGLVGEDVVGSSVCFLSGDVERSLLFSDVSEGQTYQWAWLPDDEMTSYRDLFEINPPSFNFKPRNLKI